jgi:hypothetical protein
MNEVTKKENTMVSAVVEQDPAKYSWERWRENMGKVPCPVNDGDIVEVQRANGERTIGKAGELGVWQFANQRPQNIIAYREANLKSDRVRGDLETKDRSHLIQIGDGVLYRENFAVKKGYCAGWIEGADGQVVKWLVEPFHEEKLVESAPSLVELNGMPFRDEDD